jgi:hypothetical protein
MRCLHLQVDGGSAFFRNVGKHASQYLTSRHWRRNLHTKHKSTSNNLYGTCRITRYHSALNKTLSPSLLLTLQVWIQFHQLAVKTPQLGHDRFLPNSFEFVIHLSPHHPTLYTPSTESAVIQVSSCACHAVQTKLLNSWSAHCCSTVPSVCTATWLPVFAETCCWLSSLSVLWAGAGRVMLDCAPLPCFYSSLLSRPTKTASHKRCKTNVKLSLCLIN